MNSGVDRRPLTDVATYRQALRERLNPTTAVLASTHELARSRSTRMIFAEAEEDTVLRVAIAFHEGGYGTPILVDQNERERESLQGLECDPANLEISNARLLQNTVAPAGGHEVQPDQPCVIGNT